MSDTNTTNATSFLQLVSSGKVLEAYEKYIGDGFRHHNPFFEGSAESLPEISNQSLEELADKIIAK